MRISILLLLLISLSFSSFGQKRIKKIDVRENGFNIKLNLKPITDELIQDGLKLKVIPVSPDELNTEFLNENTLNGKFDYSHYENSRTAKFLSKKKRKVEKSDFEFLIEGANWLIDNEKINEEEYEELVKSIRIYFDQTTEIDLSSANRIILANPYYVSDKYLNVFKLEITNTTTSYKTFNNEITIENGNQIQRPLRENEIIEILDNDKMLNSQKIECLKRHNLPQSITIPPNAKFEKLFAVFPIDYENDILSLSFSGNNTKLNWNVEKSKKVIDEKYTYFEFRVVYTYDGMSSGEGVNFNFLKSTEPTVFIDNNVLLIDEKHLSDKFSMITLSLDSDDLFYSKSNILGSELVDLQKNKRIPFSVDGVKISELKKKIKK